ncbi:MAG TPA: GDSL-type esterase/lipase family protein [Steroidobacteraceae bacterium]|jgi:lysophospholipase L1-like esterase|nr:GDSL-type esterase/lipase family protein [Steroidobacteraceae bacterium]
MRLGRLSTSLSLFALALSAGAAVADDRGDASELALGDSVVFGFITQAGHAYVNPTNFIGYPAYVGFRERLDDVNASCPGETSGSLLSASAPDNGCRAFRSAFPLHVGYTSTQLAFAISVLRHHRVRLVTLGIGANDLFLLQNACATNPNPTQCLQAGLPAVLAGVGQNIGQTLADIRGAGYGGEIIVVNYYSLDYSDPVGTGITALLNQAIAAPAKAFGANVADVFSAFQKVVSNPLIAGKTCNAGLLNVDPQDQTLCDVHPSQSGQRLIAEAVAHARRGW